MAARAAAGRARVPQRRPRADPTRGQRGRDPGGGPAGHAARARPHPLLQARLPGGRAQARRHEGRALLAHRRDGGARRGGIPRWPPEAGTGLLGRPSAAGARGEPLHPLRGHGGRDRDRSRELHRLPAVGAGRDGGARLREGCRAEAAGARLALSLRSLPPPYNMEWERPRKVPEKIRPRAVTRSTLHDSVPVEAAMRPNGGLNSAWWALRVGLGMGPFLAGLDKFFNILADWGMYLSPMAERFLPVSAQVFMRAVGVVEMAVGLLILAGQTRIGGYLAMGWLLAIAVNLVTTGMFYDLAVRDVEIAIAAYALARLTEARRRTV